jgi:hypothetical protein
VKIRHLIPAVDGNASEPLRVAEELTIQSIRRAVDFSPHIDVEVMPIANGDCFSPIWAENNFRVANINKPNSRDVIKVGPRIPLVADILSSFGEGHDRDLFVLSHPDIAVQPFFYEYLAHLAKESGKAGSIVRRTLPMGLLYERDWGAIYAHSGQPHSGHDCFFFPPESVKKLEVGKLYLGTPPTARVLMLNLRLLDIGFKVYRDQSATFHFGDDRDWKSNENRVLLSRMNLNEARSVVKTLKEVYPPDKVEKLLSRSGLKSLLTCEPETLSLRTTRHLQRFIDLLRPKK